MILSVFHFCQKLNYDFFKRTQIKCSVQTNNFYHSLCAALLLQRTEGKFVNRVPLQCNLLPVIGERNKLKIKENIVSCLWNFHILWGKRFGIWIFTKIAISSVHRSNLQLRRKTRGQSWGNTNLSAKKKWAKMGQQQK